MSKACPTPDELRAMAANLRTAWGSTLNKASKECADAMENAATLFEEIDKQYAASEAVVTEAVKKTESDITTAIEGSGSVGS